MGGGGAEMAEVGMGRGRVGVGCLPDELGWQASVERGQGWRPANNGAGRMCSLSTSFKFKIRLTCHCGSWCVCVFWWYASTNSYSAMSGGYGCGCEQPHLVEFFHLIHSLAVVGIEHLRLLVLGACTDLREPVSQTR